MTTAPCDILYGALRMYQPAEGHGPRVSVDTILLAHFARPARRDAVLELGCAQGAVSLIIAKRRSLAGGGNHSPKIQGIDIQEELIEMAGRNAALNNLEDYVDFQVRDLRECRTHYRAGTFGAVIMNPPYDEPLRSNPSQSTSLAAARHGSECSLSDVVCASRFLLKNGGKLFLVIRAKRVNELFFLLTDAGIRPKRIRSVHPKPDRAASVVLVEAMRDAGEGLIIEPPLFIHGTDGEYTAELLAAYRLEPAGC